MHVLDNHVWNAIVGPQAHLCERVGAAGRFMRDVAPFNGIDLSAASWDDLATLIGPGHRALLFAPDVEVPDGWRLESEFPCLQFVADALKPRAGLELVDLGPDDVDDILELIAATQPGPFSRRTIEMGRYVGYRDGGRLVAMAGERAKVPGYTEVSAVCTAVDFRGRGLGAELTLAVAEHIRERGDEAFLHVVDTNHSAIRLYESLGFALRRDDVDVLILKQPDDD
jgi:ribosomal protein S18 acetylase RimI-like enzyme